MKSMSLNFQQSHDIDWFARVGNIYVHAMSFGGVLPDAINDWDLLRRMIVSAYHLEILNEDDHQLSYNDAYINSRLSVQFDNERANQEQRFDIRNRYLRHFREMARLGFYSFDRSIEEDEEDVYYLVVKPSRPLENWNILLKDTEWPRLEVSRNDSDIFNSFRVVR